MNDSAATANAMMACIISGFNETPIAADIPIIPWYVDFSLSLSFNHVNIGLNLGMNIEVKLSIGIMGLLFNTLITFWENLSGILGASTGSTYSGSG